MSFQDVGKKKKKKGPPRPATGAAATVSPVVASNNPLGQTSESLLQYQRNVGMLENIVQSLLARPNSRNTELDAQYDAQIDVITQLGSKLSQQLALGKSESADKTVWIKLERDLDKIQSRVRTLQDSVGRVRALQLKHEQTLEDAAAHGPSDPAQDYEFQQQMQLQQDRMNEEIMREREEEIRNINRGMHQVNEIYRDLAHIVGSQQEQIDSIETQMEDSRVNAEAGLKQVEQANDKYGSANCVIS